MTEYVKILSGESTATMTSSTVGDAIQTARSEECPGEGWYPVVKAEKPEIARGQEFAFTYTIRDGVAYKTYFTVPYGTVFGHRVFSKLKVIEALMSENLWAQAKAVIEQAGLYDLYLAAQNFREDNPFFTQAVSTLKSQLGVTDEVVNRVLNSSLADVQRQI